MASSSYCLELEPRVLRLKLAPPDTNISPAAAGWSFLQSLAKTPGIHAGEAYIPPSSKRGGSVLSGKSLEMCTESLGSETGSDGGDSSDEMSMLSYHNREISPRPRKLREAARMNRSVSFPPPLTSISGGGAVLMRPRREGGRLVLEAVSVSNSSPAYFKAERTDGRLRIHMMKEFNSEEEEEEEEEVEEKSEYEVEKLQRLSRCGSGDCSLINWEPFWVAT